MPRNLDTYSSVRKHDIPEIRFLWTLWTVRAMRKEKSDLPQPQIPPWSRFRFFTKILVNFTFWAGQRAPESKSDKFDHVIRVQCPSSVRARNMIANGPLARILRPVEDRPRKSGSSGLKIRSDHLIQRSLGCYRWLPNKGDSDEGGGFWRRIPLIAYVAKNRFS